MTSQTLHKDRVIGSSDAPVIMGVSPWKTPRQLWEEKVFGANDKDSFAKKRGRDMEDTARKCFEKKMGTLVAPEHLIHKKNPWMTASLDGIDYEGKVVVEIKCPNKEDHATALSGKVPEKYIPQVQHQLEVAGLDGMYYFSYDGTDGVIVEVARDQTYIDQLFPKEKEFYECVLNLKEPELSDKDWISKDKDDQWVHTALQWKAINETLKSVEKSEEELRQQLIELAGDQNIIGAGVKLSRSFARGSVDYAKIPELKSVDLEQYRKSSIKKYRLTAIQ